MSVRANDFSLESGKRLVDFTSDESLRKKLSETSKEELRKLMAGSLLSLQQLITGLNIGSKLALDDKIFNPGSDGSLTIDDVKLTIPELYDLLSGIATKAAKMQEDNDNLLLLAEKQGIADENLLPDNFVPQSGAIDISNLRLMGGKKNKIVEQQDWSDLNLGITNGSASLLWISQQIAVMLIESNTQAAKIAADAANLLNRILSELSAVSQFLTTLSSIYTEALNVKQAKEIKDESNQGITSSTITFVDLIDNNQPPDIGDETPNLTYTTYTDKDGNVREGFLMTDVPDVMKSLMGLNGGSFNYLDWNGYYIQNKDGEWVKDGTMVDESVEKVTEKKGYIFVDSVTINSLMVYTSQLLALAVPGSSNNPDGDFYNSYGDAYKNNITIQGAIDGLANSVKQVQNLLSSVTQQVSIYQGNTQSATTPFSTILAMMNQILNMLGA